MGRSLGLVVKGRVSLSEGCEFESQSRILDGHFSTLRLEVFQKKIYLEKCKLYPIGGVVKSILAENSNFGGFFVAKKVCSMVSLNRLSSPAKSYIQCDQILVNVKSIWQFLECFSGSI